VVRSLTVARQAACSGGAGGSRLLPHELLCAMFFAYLWIRLAAAAGWLASDTLVSLLFLAASVAAAALCPVPRTDLRWRLRLAAHPLLMNLAYFWMETAIPRLDPTPADEALQIADGWLVGTSLCLRLEDWIHPAATELLSFCYIWYLAYLFSSQIEYLCGPVRLLKRFYAGMFTIYAIGYVGYSSLPAAGPYLAMADRFRVPLEGGWFTRFASELVLAASNRVDIFPSLHVANSLYILLFDRLHKPWRFRLCLIPCAGLFISTIYLRYHYFIDVVCGAALSFLALWMASRIRPHES
jgi:membrane-associated phospholipid phosphatase